MEVESREIDYTAQLEEMFEAGLFQLSDIMPCDRDWETYVFV